MVGALRAGARFTVLAASEAAGFLTTGAAGARRSASNPRGGIAAAKAKGEGEGNCCTDGERAKGVVNESSRQSASVQADEDEEARCDPVGHVRRNPRPGRIGNQVT